MFPWGRPAAGLAEREPPDAGLPWGRRPAGLPRLARTDPARFSPSEVRS